MSLEVKNLRHRLATHFMLNVPDATFASGHCHWIAGPNGSGKSTLMRALAGLSNIQGHSIHLHGKELNDWTPERRARSIAWSPGWIAADAHLKVIDYLLLSLYPWHQGYPNRSHLQKCVDILEDFLLSDRLQHPVSTLSLGQKQRLELARLCCAEVQVLLLDEVFAHMDPYHFFHCWHRLSRWLNQERIIIASIHDLNLLVQLSESYWLMWKGSIHRSSTFDLAASTLPLLSHWTSEVEVLGTPAKSALHFEQCQRLRSANQPVLSQRPTT